MSTDRELLELAAKACGFQWRWFGEKLCTVRDFQYMRHEHWNPHGDDGDSLRLAYDLKIKIDPAKCEAWWPDGHHWRCIAWDFHEGMIGLRRAIVHCAAEIGRAMP